jgi:hypothetical protein
MANHLVYKNTGAEHLDDFYSGTPEQLNRAYDEALAAVQGGNDAVLEWTQGRTQTSGLPARNHENLASDWLATGLGGKHADRILRHGYEEAMKLARSHRPEPLPIETLFVRGCGDDFELHLCEGKRSVTVVLFVPSRPGLSEDYGSENAKSKSWVVRAGGAAGAEVLQDAEPPVVKARTSGAR